MKRMRTFRNVAVIAMLYSTHVLSASTGMHTATSAQNTLSTDIMSCSSRTLPIEVCQEKLIANIKSQADKTREPLDRNVRHLAATLSNALAERKLGLDRASRLARGILAILQGGDLSAAAFSDRLAEVGSELRDDGVTEKDRSSVVGALLIVGQDIRGPQDTGAQNRRRMPTDNGQLPRPK